jgi:glycosyltransferase involved in cell wall biosynthesis
MRIIFLINDIHLGGGGERVTKNLANAFVRLGYQVSIISLCHPKFDSFHADLDSNITVSYLRSDKTKFNLINKLHALYLINKVINRKAKSIYLGIGTYPSILLGAILRKKNIVSVGCMHGSYSALSGFWKYLTRRYFPRLNWIVSLTEYDKVILKTINNNVVVIPNCTHFMTDEVASLDTPKMLALGRLSKEKDFFRMIDLFEKFSSQHNEWTLTLRGDGPLRDDLISYILKKGLNSRIILLTPTSEVEEEYLTASIVLLTSLNEGLPMVLIEAQTFGVPVISFNCLTGPAEIIKDGETGFLVEQEANEEFLEKMELLASDKELRKRMGENAVRNAVRFREEQVIRQWKMFLEQIY